MGAAITRDLLRKHGITLAGTIMLVALAASLLLGTLVTADAPLWVPIAVMSIYAAASVGASIPLTNAVMNHAVEGDEGSASVFAAPPATLVTPSV